MEKNEVMLVERVSTDSTAIDAKFEKVIKKDRKRFRFDAAPFSPPATRNYGLMRVDPVQASTPFPRVSGTKDLSTLSERLIEERNSMFATIGIDPPSEIAVDQTASKATPFHDSGTPDPKQYNIVNGTLPMKRFSDRQSLEERVVRSTSFLEDSSSENSISDYMSFGTPHPKKQIVLNPGKLVKHLTNASSSDQHVKQHSKKKKVILICPELSIARLTRSADSKESFKKRRRDFHMAEFTIARNGKKMSDIQMGQQDIELAPKYQADETYQSIIEDYIQAKGFMKTTRNELISLSKNTNLGRSEYSSDTSHETFNHHASTSQNNREHQTTIAFIEE
ncbi:uncharacterized protein LOC116803667 [Drosophila mojavensis]|nr:uncharacterized protein LOC116803667 [Drosophila mojavensis]